MLSKAARSRSCLNRDQNLDCSCIELLAKVSEVTEFVADQENRSHCFR